MWLRARRVLEAVENCALDTGGTVGDALCAEVMEVVPKVVEEVMNVVEDAMNMVEEVMNVEEEVMNVEEVVLYLLEVVNSVRCVLWRCWTCRR